MAIKSRSLRHILAALLFLFPGAFLEAQAGRYYSEQRFIQRLAWAGDEYTLRYEVQVEKEEQGEYRSAVREFTDAPFIELSLPPGNYRYRVIPYDILNRPGRGSEWLIIEVLAAVFPELDDVSPVLFSIGGNTVHTLNIYGKDIQRGAAFSLRRPGSAAIVPVEVQILADGSRAVLHFNNDQLVPGVYEISVINPSGLETRKGEISVVNPEPVPIAVSGPEHVPVPETEIKPEESKNEPSAPVEDRKSYDLRLSAVWMPVVHFYGKNGLFFEKGFSDLGAAARLGVVLNKTGFFNPGMEFTVSSYSFSAAPDMVQHAAAFEFNLLAQKLSPSRIIAVTVRLGAGFTILPGGNGQFFHAGAELFHTNMGFSFLLPALEHFYFEAGLDYAHSFTGLSSGYLRPSTGMGWRF
jgi:hypothetical protein